MVDAVSRSNLLTLSRVGAASGSSRAAPITSAERSSAREERVQAGVGGQVRRPGFDRPLRAQRPAGLDVVLDVAVRQRDGVDEQRVDLQALSGEHPERDAGGQVHPLVVAGDVARAEVALRYVLLL